MNPILDAALDYAAQGWPVLAIKAGTKQPRDPAVNGGPRWNATTDLEAISKRWGIAEPPGIGIACGIASGLLVIDIDTEDGHGVDGPASLAELEAKHGPLPATVEAKTPSGGRHLYFRYPKDREVRNGTSVIGRGIDHRGEGGYVVAAPTKRPDGAYRWFKSPDDCKICDCPTWLLDLMAPESPQETHTATQGDSSAPLDSQVIDCESPEPPQSPSEVSAWAEAALRDEVTKLWATPEGQRNHALNTAAFNLSQIIEGGGLDRNRVEAELRATALEIGLTNDEIGKTIRSGFEAGAKEPRHSKEQKTATVAFKAPNDFLSWSVTDPATIPRTNFLYGDFIAAGYTSLTVAAPKVGKSLLALTEAVDAAAGGSILLDVMAPKRKVLYYCAEDDQNTIDARVVAICKQHHIDQAELVGQLFPVSGINRDDFFLASGDDAKINEQLFEWLQGFVTENGIEIVVLDPLQDMTTCPETNEVFRRVGQRLRSFANVTSCGVHLVHHTRKMMAGSTPTIDDARGGGALRGTSRFNRILVPMTEAEGTEASVEEHWRYFRVGDAESNLAPPTANSNRWFKKATLEIADSHFQPAIHRWTWPGPLAGLPPDAIRTVSNLACEAERNGVPLRESPQAADWGGYEIAKVLKVPVDKTGKAKIKRLIKNMLNDGHLEKMTSEQNEKGKTHPVLVSPDCRKNHGPDPMEDFV